MSHSLLLLPNARINPTIGIKWVGKQRNNTSCDECQYKVCLNYSVKRQAWKC